MKTLKETPTDIFDLCKFISEDQIQISHPKHAKQHLCSIYLLLCFWPPDEIWSNIHSLSSSHLTYVCCFVTSVPVDWNELQRIVGFGDSVRLKPFPWQQDSLLMCSIHFNDFNVQHEWWYWLSESVSVCWISQEHVNCGDIFSTSVEFLKST